MSRVAKNPVAVPKGVDVAVDGQRIQVKGSKGTMSWNVHPSVAIERDEDGAFTFAPKDSSKEAHALSGTTRALVSNMVQGVSEGFQRKLELQGVGYRAQAQGKTLNLQLGYSHPIKYEMPEGIEVATPSQTEVVISGTDKQLVGQVSAEIRSFRPPEPYKGKGVRYSGERVRRKEAKKK